VEREGGNEKREGGMERGWMLKRGEGKGQGRKGKRVGAPSNKNLPVHH